MLVLQAVDRPAKPVDESVICVLEHPVVDVQCNLGRGSILTGELLRPLDDPRVIDFDPFLESES